MYILHNIRTYLTSALRLAAEGMIHPALQAPCQNAFIRELSAP